MPLCLISEDHVDLALVLSKAKGGYLAHTIFPLDWAYKHSRLITRPDSDWLRPECLYTDSDTNNDDYSDIIN